MTDLSQKCEPEQRAVVAWKYVLGDGKWRYQKEWSGGANMLPVFDLTPDIVEALQIDKSQARA